MQWIFLFQLIESAGRIESLVFETFLSRTEFFLHFRDCSFISRQLVVQPFLYLPDRVSSYAQIRFYIVVPVSRKQSSRDDDPPSEHDAFAFGQQVAQKELHCLSSSDSCRSSVERIQNLDALFLGKFASPYFHIIQHTYK